MNVQFCNEMNYFIFNEIETGKYIKISNKWGVKISENFKFIYLYKVVNETKKKLHWIFSKNILISYIETIRYKLTSTHITDDIMYKDLSVMLYAVNTFEKKELDDFWGFIVNLEDKILDNKYY